MSTKRRRYLSYLLRLWQIESEGELVWRTSLESPQTGERTDFPSLDALFTFLEQQISVVSDSEDDNGEARGQ
jgi:hypothetical protein